MHGRPSWLRGASEEGEGREGKSPGTLCGEASAQLGTRPGGAGGPENVPRMKTEPGQEALRVPEGEASVGMDVKP